MAEKNTLGRRTILKTLGGSIAGSGLIGQATAKESDQEIYKNGLDILQKTGDRGAFEDYIFNQGYRPIHKRTERFPYADSEDDVSINRAESNDLHLHASLTGTDSDTRYAYGEWAVIKDTDDAWNDFDDAGAPPVDIVGIGWEHTDYDAVWDSWHSSSYTSKRIADSNHVAFNFNDKDAQGDPRGPYKSYPGGEANFSGWACVELNPTEPVENRGIIVNYQHTWGQLGVSGVSFDNGGSMSIGVDFSVGKWSSPRQAYASDGTNMPYHGHLWD